MLTHARAVALVAVTAAIASMTVGDDAHAQSTPPRVAPAPDALPTGGQVVGGQASIQQSGSTMTVNQGTDRSAIDWATFNVGEQAQVNFVQPSSSSVMLNRVQGSDASQIFGRINANGQVFLSNPNGVYFAPGASVDVGGLVATTHRMSLDDFMAGKLRFERNGATGSVVNEGELRAALGGYVALLAPEVRNQGVILANMGTVALAAGEAFELQFDGNNTLASLRVTPSTIKALVDNRRAVLAPGGLVILSAQALDRVQGGVVRNSGDIEATALSRRGGRVVLDASDSVELTGRIDASGSTGGSITVTGDSIALNDSARLDARGSTAGGEVLVGGDWQGSGSLRQATSVTLGSQARIDVSATQQGDGGKAVLWSNIDDVRSSTVVEGTILASGAGSGRGGQIETSGHGLQVASSANVQTSAGGQWLLDPADITIASSDSGYTNVGGTYTPNSGTATATVNAATLVNALNNGDVTVTTRNTGTSGSGNGNILVNSSLLKTGTTDSTLTLQATGNITVNGGVTLSSAASKLNLIFISDWDSSGAGAIYFNGNSSPITVNTRGGHVWLGGNGYATGYGITSWNGLAVGTGYANSGDGATVYEGVNLNRTTINTSGGNLYAAGWDSHFVNDQDRYGIRIQNDTLLNTGAGNLTLNGFLQPRTGSLAILPMAYGVSIDSSTLQSTTGNISITGGEGATAVSTVQGGTAVLIRNSAITTTGTSGNAGSIDITGTTGPYNAPEARDGVKIRADGASATATISTVGGNINLTGTSWVTNNGNTGVSLLTSQPSDTAGSSPIVKVTSRTGSVTITGDLPDNTATGSNGILLRGNNLGKIYIGYDGTNAHTGNTSLIGRSLTILNFAPGNLNLGGSGTLAILPTGSSFVRGISTPDTLTIDGQVALGSSHSAVTIGKDLGSGNPTHALNINAPITATGPINLYSKTLNLNGNLTTTGVGARILAKTSDNITGQSGLVLQTNGGDITLWSDSDNSGSGYILLNNNSRLDSRTSSDRAQSRISRTSGGGNITLAGGLDTDGDGRPEGPAVSVTQDRGGINFGDQVINHDNVNAIYSGGGDVVMRGSSSTLMGINWVNGGTLDAGNGAVSLTGTSTSGHGIELGSWNNGGRVDVISNAASTPAPAITITGTSNGTGRGIFFNSARIEALGAGGITLTGSSASARGSAGGIAGGPDVLASTGAIVIDGGQSGIGLTGGYLGARAGTDVTSSSSNVTLTGDAVNFFGVHANTTGVLTIQPATSFASAYAWPLTSAALTLDAPISGLTLGRPGNTAALSITSATTVTGPINLYGGNVSINAPLTATNGTIGIQASGNVSDGASGYLVADGLWLQGGNVTLDHGSNKVGTLAANAVSSLTYVNGSGLTVGSVGNRSGITASGPIDVRTASGDLTIASDVTTTSNSAAALSLNAGTNAAAATASGGNIIVSGTPTVSVGSGGTGRLYSGSVSGSTGLGALIGQGSGRFRYGSDEVATNYSLALGSGLNGIYREQPTVTQIIDDQTLVYGAAYAPSVSLGGGQNGDTYTQAFATAPTVSVGGAVSGAGRAVVGTHMLSGTGGSAVSQLGYAVSGGIAPGTLTVTPRTLTTSFLASDKVYDGSTSATVTPATNDALSGDSVSVSLAGGTFSDANAGTGKAVAVTGIGLSGSDAANYVVGSSGTSSASITPRTITLSGSRVYDGTTTLGAGDVVIGNLVDGQTLSYSAASSVDAHVVTAGNHVDAITLGDGGNGGLASNYRLPVLNTANAPVTISPRPLTATAVIDGALSRVYDATTSAPVATIHGSVSGGIVGDTLALNTGGVTLAYDSPDVVSATRIAAGGNAGFSIVGSAQASQASDYVFAAPTIAPVAASITPRVVTLSGTKVYDGTTELAPGQIIVGNLVGSQSLTYTQASSADAHVATAGNHIGAITLADGANGGLASNYQLPLLDASNAPVTVTPRPITTNAIIEGTLSRIYDGTTSAHGATVTGSIVGAAAGDALTLEASSVTLAYNSPNVAGATRIAATGSPGFSIASSAHASQSSDYSFSAPSIAPVAASISPAQLNVIANNDARFVTTADNPAYNGVSYSGFVHGEDASVVNGTVAIHRINGGTNGDTAAGTYSGVLVPDPSNANAANYTMVPRNGNYTIVGSNELLVRANNVSTTYGSTPVYSIASAQYWDSTTQSAVTLNTVNDLGHGRFVVSDGAGGSATFTLMPHGAGTSTSGSTQVGAYQLGASNVTTQNAQNFSNVLTVVGSQTVTARPLTASATNGISKVYDGTNAMNGLSIGLAGLQDSDQVTANGNGAFSTIHAGSNVGYTVSELTLAGSDAGNYYLAGNGHFSGGNGTIAPRPLTVAYTGIDKVYDGNTQASFTSTDNRIPGDALTVNGAGAFGDKNVGTNKPVTISGVSLSGPSAGDYQLAETTGSTRASITRLDSVTWTGGTDGNWFDPANWAGGAVPDLSNVANVVIPSGVNVTFDPAGAAAPAQTGPVNVDSLGRGGSLTQNEGSLNIGPGGTTLAGLNQNGGSFASQGSMDLGGFTQTGGSTRADASFNVNGGFNQGSNGTVTVAGNTSINVPQGNAVIGNLQTGGDLAIATGSGDIVQAPGTTIVAAGASTLDAGRSNIVLDGAGNDFGGTVNATGSDVRITTPGASGSALASNGMPVILAPAAPSMALPLPADAPSALTAASDGITIRLVRRADGKNEGLLEIQVPGDMVSAGFGFEIPTELLGRTDTQSASYVVTAADGAALPAWLRHVTGSQRISGAAARGALPLTLAISTGPMRARIRIVERAQ